MKRTGLLLFFCFLSGSFFCQITLIPTNTTNNLLSISIFTNNIVVAGRDNYLVKSYNDCNTLSPLTEPEPINFQNYLCRVDTSIAYMLSTNQAANSYKIYKSTDGCSNWTKKMDTSNLFLKQLKFFNTTSGIAAADYLLIHTSDGGTTWTTSTSPVIVPTVLEVFNDSTVCLGGTNGGTGIVLISKNKGNSWIGGGIQSIPWSITILGGGDTILATSFQLTDPNFSKSINGGSNFVDIPLPDMKFAYGIKFKNYREGYVLGSNVNNYGVILKTTDFGQTWTTFNIQIQCTLLDMTFLNDSIALVSGSNGVLFKWNSKQAVFTGIKTNSFENLELKLYPNPVKDRVKLEFSFPIPQLNFALQNALGQQLGEGALGPEREIDLRSYAAGVYFLTLHNNNSGQKVFKIIKE